MKRETLLVINESEKPILLFDDECAVRRHIAHWVQNLPHNKSARRP